MSASSHARTTTLAAILAAFVFCLSACPPSGRSSEGSPQKPVAACKKDGENCEYAPGKIGLCTAKIGDCDEAPCLTCTSLH